MCEQRGERPLVKCLRFYSELFGQQRACGILFREYWYLFRIVAEVIVA